MIYYQHQPRSKQMIKTIWVMYNEGTRDGTPLRQGSKRVSQDCQHVGYPVGPDTSDSNYEHQLARAKATVTEFRDLASRGKHFLNERQWSNLVINSAWLEVERRDRLEF
jgi:hypothetical protein